MECGRLVGGALSLWRGWSTRSRPRECPFAWLRHCRLCLQAAARDHTINARIVPHRPRRLERDNTTRAPRSRIVTLPVKCIRPVASSPGPTSPWSNRDPCVPLRCSTMEPSCCGTAATRPCRSTTTTAGRDVGHLVGCLPVTTDDRRRTTSQQRSLRQLCCEHPRARSPPDIRGPAPRKTAPTGSLCLWACPPPPRVRPTRSQALRRRRPSNTCGQLWRGSCPPPLLIARPILVHWSAGRQLCLVPVEARPPARCRIRLAALLSLRRRRECCNGGDGRSDGSGESACSSSALRDASELAREYCV